MSKQSLSFSMSVILLLTSFQAHTQSTPKPASSKKLAVNTTESKVNWIGKKPTGEHNGYVKLSAGEVTVDKHGITGGSFVIDLNTIIDLDLKDEGMNARLVGHLKSADFFDVDKYPTASFVITKITKLTNTTAGVAKSTHRVEGDLTIKGITKKITFDASINLLNNKLTASTSSFTINRTDWGVNYQSKSIFAELKDQFIYDDMTLSIDLVTK